jgi:hypothetical protein
MAMLALKKTEEAGPCQVRRPLVPEVRKEEIAILGRTSTASETSASAKWSFVSGTLGATPRKIAQDQRELKRSPLYVL